MENYQQNHPEQDVSTGNWLVTLILICIPFVNILMLIVWAFGGEVPVSKSNFAKATFIMMIIGLVICFLFGSFIASFFSTACSGIF